MTVRGGKGKDGVDATHVIIYGLGALTFLFDLLISLGLVSQYTSPLSPGWSAVDLKILGLTPKLPTTNVRCGCSCPPSFCMFP